MNIPNREWYKEIYKRRSRRQFNKDEVSEEIFLNIEEHIDQLNSCYTNERIIILENVDRSSKPLVGLFMSISNAPLYAAIISKKPSESYVNVGYMGESLILEAKLNDLDSTWIVSTKNKYGELSEIELEDEEEIVAAIALGYSDPDFSKDEEMLRKMLNAHLKRTLKEVCVNDDPLNLPRWAKIAIDVARLAPSALNRQGTRYEVGEDYIKVMLDTEEDIIDNVSKRIDAGAAMVHVETGLLYLGKTGSWEILDSPDVAVFKLD